MMDKVVVIIRSRVDNVTLFVAFFQIYHMMTELERRDITPPAAAEKLMDGLKTLVETFSGSEELRQSIIELESEEPLSREVGKEGSKGGKGM